MLRTKSGETLYGLLWIFILVVSVIDTHMAMVQGPTMVETELNPIFRKLVLLRDGKMDFAVPMKLFGTSLAMGFLCWYRGRKYDMFICCSVAFGQLLVLFTYCPIWILR
tara:strand:+ start:709 stop:1035 length:327 start_codon:yes stop_codon:yes gene_type:complete